LVRFCEDELPDENDKDDPIAEADQIDREVDVQTVRAFLGWLLSNSNFKRLDAFMSYCRHRIAKDPEVSVQGHPKEG